MADYKFETLASATVAWTVSSGTKLTVTVALVQESSDYFGNGDYKPTRDGLSVTTSHTIDGVDQPRDWVQKLSVAQGAATHRIGKIGLTAERNTLIQAADAAVKAHPAWVAKLAAEQAGIKASREYEANTKAVDKMMMPGGSY